MKYTLRPVQQKCVDDILDYCENKYKGPGIVVAPTGFGKSLVIAETIKQMGNPHTLVLQPSKELLIQNHNKYTDQGGEASLYSASVGKKEVGRVTYATPGSVKNDWVKFHEVTLVLLDECHFLVNPSGMIADFLEQLNPDIKVIGLTATPIKLKSYGEYSQLNILTRIRPRFFSKIIHVTQVSDMLDLGYLCPLRYTYFDFDRTLLKMKGSDFDNESASAELMRQGKTPFAIELIKKSLEKGKKKILVFTPTVGDSYYLKEAIPEIEVVSAKTKKKDRTEIVRKFATGETRVISNYGTLVLGFDQPDIDLIIMLRPTNSFAVWYQATGRGIRIAPGKKVCDVVDLSGNYQVFGDVKDLKVEQVKGDGWAMTVKDYVITGRPVGTKIHKNNLDISKKPITFGNKWKGTPADQVPTSYLKWVAENWDLSTSYAKRHIVPVLKVLGIMT